jgi:hypothetical protein
VYPRTLINGRRERSTYELFAANGSVIADVSKPIIGVDFLSFYGLLVDVRNRRLVDSATSIAIAGKLSTDKQKHVKAINGMSRFHDILAEFPEVTRPAGISSSPKHRTLHYIHRTPGHPVSCKPRRLAPDRLQSAKAEFDIMLKTGIARRNYI